MNKMKKMKVLTGALTLLVVIGMLFTVSSCGPAKPTAQKASAAGKGAPTAKVPAKKVFSKGMGGLMVKIVNIKNAPSSMRIRAFRAVDSRSSVYQATFYSNLTQELAAGTYDIEIETVPARIYKGVSVKSGRETVHDMGCITGSVNVKALNAKKAPAAYPVRIFYGGTKLLAAATAANRPVEIGPGVYDVEVVMVPSVSRKDIRVDAAREAVIDIGCVVGSVIVNASDENKKEQRFTVRVRRTQTAEMIATGVTNRPIEIGEGTYDVEVMSVPAQITKGVQVKPGAEAAIEIIVVSPPVLPTEAPAKQVSGVPSKKR